MSNKPGVLSKSLSHAPDVQPQKKNKDLVEDIVVGQLPRDIVFTADQSHAYVSNGGSDSVSVIDTRTRQVIKTIPGLSTPYVLALQPNSTRLFVGNLSTPTLSIIDTETNNIIDTYDNFNRIAGIAFNKEGTKAYVSCVRANRVYVLNAHTCEVLKSFEVINPGGLAFSNEYARLYVGAGPGIIMINPAGDGEIIGTIEGVTGSVNIAFTPHHYQSPKAYITNYSGNVASLFVLNSSNDTVKQLTGFNGPHAITMHPFLQRAYFSIPHSNTIGVIDTSEDKVLGFIENLQFPLGMKVTHDGEAIYVCNRDAGSVSVIKLF